MIGISIYHWLPLAENMFPDIEKALWSLYSSDEITIQNGQESKLSFIKEPSRDEGGAISYYFEWYSHYGAFSAYGKIDVNGFSQHVTNFVPKNDQIQDSIHNGVDGFLSLIIDLLIKALPRAARNKIAVLAENILSRQEFEAADNLTTDFDPSAKEFLKAYRIVVIHLDKHYYETASNLNLEKLSLKTSPVNHPQHSSKIGGSLLAISQKTTTLINNKETHLLNPQNFLFCNNDYDLTNDFKNVVDIDTVFFKFFSLIIFSECLYRTIDILKATRDHLTLERRSLVVNLRENTENYFPLLTHIKKYLTYVDIKIPVIGKVASHIQDNAEKKPQNKDTEIHQTSYKKTKFINETFYEIVEIVLGLDSKSLINVNLITRKELKPEEIIWRIQQNADRLIKLYKEEELEARILSDELSQVLEGTLLDESREIVSRELDTSRATLELDRGGKNRGNALKFLSVVTSSSLGFTFGGEIANLINIYLPQFSFESNKISVLLKLLFGLLFFILARNYTENFIATRANSYRLLIPIKKLFPQQVLRELTQGISLKQVDSYGNRRLRRWEKKLYVNRVNNNKVFWFKRWLTKVVSQIFNTHLPFDITMDYETRGFVHSLTLETEADDVGFITIPLVEQSILLFFDDGHLENSKEYKQLFPEDKSLYIEVLTQLGIRFSDELIAMNRILALSRDEIQHQLKIYIDNERDSTLSFEDKIELDHICQHYEAYLEKLRSIKNDKILLRLIGENNIDIKHNIVSGYGSECSPRRNK